MLNSGLLYGRTTLLADMGNCKGKAIRDLLKPEADERKRESGKRTGRGHKKVAENFRDVSFGETRDKVGEAFGVSGKAQRALRFDMGVFDDRLRERGVRPKRTKPPCKADLPAHLLPADNASLWADAFCPPSRRPVPAGRFRALYLRTVWGCGPEPYENVLTD